MDCGFLFWVIGIYKIKGNKKKYKLKKKLNYFSSSNYTMADNRATFTAKFLKEAQYESKLFKVVEVNTDHPLLDKFVKNWEDMRMIYLKNKYLNVKKLEVGSYYKFLVYFEQFTNNEDKEIIYINKIRHKSVEFDERVYMDSEDDSDF